jgi:NAD(P)-dependent dehydrogenase (short-subunit alcohol dehydrogenase family)
MNLSGARAVITGAAAGIGRACARRFAAEGARLVVSDIEADSLRALAEEIGASPIAADVGRAAEVARLVEQAEATLGGIDLFYSNAGIAFEGGPEVTDEAWDRMWRINTMAHVWAARYAVPRMAERGGGYLVSTASAAGLLMEPGSAPYTLTKHAAVALAEWLAVNYRDRGLRVSVVCPQGVNTAMLGDVGRGRSLVAGDGILEPEQVAEAVVAGIRAEEFLILPHPQVREYERRKTADRDRWLRGMARMVRSS